MPWTEALSCHLDNVTPGLSANMHERPVNQYTLKMEAVKVLRNETERIVYEARHEEQGVAWNRTFHPTKAARALKKLAALLMALRGLNSTRKLLSKSVTAPVSSACYSWSGGL